MPCRNKQMKAKKINRAILAVAKLVKYGVDWIDSYGSAAYAAGSRDTVAHIVACWLCQEYSHTSEPTNDVYNELGLSGDVSYKPVRYWYEKLKRMTDRRRRKPQARK